MTLKTPVRHITCTLIAFAAALAFVASIALTSCANVPKISLEPALKDTYDIALEAALAKSDDCVLVAIQSTTSVTSEIEPTWMYLFFSQSRNYLYTVFPGENPVAANYAPASLTQEAYLALPRLNGTELDAQEALALVEKQLQKNGLSYRSVKATLVMYFIGDNAPTNQTMRWYFDFNLAEIDPESEQAEPNKPFSYSVDLYTGEVTKEEQPL